MDAAGCPAPLPLAEGRSLRALLEGREPARHAGLGQPHLVGRTAETAQLRHAGKDEQVVRVDGSGVERA